MSDHFSPDILERNVHETLDAAFSGVPEGKRAGIFIDATKDSAQFVLAAKVNNHWQIALQSEWDGHKVDGKISTAILW